MTPASMRNKRTGHVEPVLILAERRGCFLVTPDLPLPAGSALASAPFGDRNEPPATLFWLGPDDWELA